MRTGETATEALGAVRTLWDAGAIGRLGDAELIGRFLVGPVEGAEAAFAALVERHGPMVRRVALDVLGDPHAALDAAQATFLVLARRARSIRRPDSLGPWLHGVALRVARRARADQVRRREVERRGAALMADRRSAIADDPLPCPELHEEIDRLPSQFRAAIVVFHLQGRTHAQAAADLGWPLGTLQARLHRARLRLRTRLARRGLAPAALATAGLASSSADAFALPPGWVEATARAAVRFAAGGPTGGLVTTAVVQLASRSSSALARLALVPIALGALAVGLVAAGSTLIPRDPAPAVAVEAPAPLPTPVAATLPTRVDDPPPPEPRPGRLVVRGVVVDEAGVPVPRAAVRVRGWIRAETEGVADDAGTFVLTLPDAVAARHRPVELLIHAIAADRKLQGLVRFRATGAVLTEPFRVVARPERKMTILVADDAGRPVPGASVEVADIYTSLVAGATDADGRFEAGVPGDMSLYWVVGLKSGVGFDYYENYKAWPPDRNDPLSPPDQVRLVLDGAADARARVVDSAGEPVPDVKLYTWYAKKPGKIEKANLGAYTIAWATTGPDGVAAFGWVPRTLDGEIPIRTWPWGPYQGDDLPDQNIARDKPEVGFRVLRATRVSGRVVEADGRPAGGVPVEARGFGLGRNPTDYAMLTADDGAFAFDLAPGRHYIIASVAPDRAAPSWTGLIVEEGQPREGLTLRLGPVATIRGRVVGPEGEPASDQIVTFAELGAKIAMAESDPNTLEDQEMIPRWATTDPDGRYSLRVGPGTFKAYGPSNKLANRFPSVPENLRIAAGQVIERDFQIDPPDPVALAGRVLGPDGLPTAGAILQAQPIGRSGIGLSRFQAEADAAGRFRADRYREPVLVVARTPGDVFAGAARVEPDQDEVEIRLAPAAAARGRVLDRDGMPVVGAVVQLGWGMEPSQGEGAHQGPFHENLPTDDQGRYAAVGLPVGAWVQVTVAVVDKPRASESFQVERAGDLLIPDLVLDGPPRDRR